MSSTEPGTQQGSASACPLPCPELSLHALGRGLPLLTTPSQAHPKKPRSGRSSLLWPVGTSPTHLTSLCLPGTWHLIQGGGFAHSCLPLFSPPKGQYTPVLQVSSQEGSPHCFLHPGLVVRVGIRGRMLGWKLSVTVYLSDPGPAAYSFCASVPPAVKWGHSEKQRRKGI